MIKKKNKKPTTHKVKSFAHLNKKIDVKEEYNFVYIQHLDGTLSLCRSTTLAPNEIIILENDYKTLPAWTRKIGGQSLSKEKEFSQKYKNIDWNI